MSAHLRKANSGWFRLWFFTSSPFAMDLQSLQAPIDPPQVSKKKCHFNRMEFTILFLCLPQNVSILCIYIYIYEDSPNKFPSPISKHKRFKQWNQSSIKKNVPINSSGRWGLIASSGSHLLLVLLTLAGIDGGRAALMKFYPGTMSCPKLALLSLVMYPEKRCGFFVWSFLMFTWFLFFPSAKPKELLHLLKKEEQQKKTVATASK